jgi:hypothetical protein
MVARTQIMMMKSQPKRRNPQKRKPNLLRLNYLIQMTISLLLGGNMEDLASLLKKRPPNSFQFQCSMYRCLSPLKTHQSSDAERHTRQIDMSLKNLVSKGHLC